MAVNDAHKMQHKIEARLFPNDAGKGKNESSFVARTKAEAPLTITDVCAAVKNREGWTGRYDDLLEYAHIFVNEVVNQLLSGFSVQLGGFCSLHTCITGTYRSANDRIGSENLHVAFREMRQLKELLLKVKIENGGIAGDRAHIDEIIDVHSKAVNKALTPGDMVHIVGNKIKVEGESPEAGVWFVRQGDGARVKLAGHLGINRAAELVGTIPALTSGSYKIAVVTYFSGGSKPLKMPRVITGEPELIVA